MVSFCHNIKGRGALSAIVLGSLVFILIALGVYYFVVSAPKSVPRADNTTPPEVVGGDQDEHGCLVAAGYAWCESKKACIRSFEEFCSDTVASVVQEITANTNVRLAYQGNKVFNWIAPAEDTTVDVTIAGVAYGSLNAQWIEYETIEKYLNSIAEPDTYNLADGFPGVLRGYQYRYLACDLSFRRKIMDEDDASGQVSAPRPAVIGSLGLVCGFFNKNQTIYPAQSATPAAGVCGSSSTDEARIEITPGIPSPRCMRVVPGQRLLIANKTPEQIA
ncbi:MAG: hypothetical protein A3B31_01460, partial [Candidatus Komeilibacteria bacterium RIFCSPLOWO2_01_FULL_53_11]